MTDVSPKRTYQVPRLVVHGSIAGLTRQTPTPTPTPTPTTTPPGPSQMGSDFEDLGTHDLGTSL